MTRAARFKQADIERACKGLVAAGFAISGVEVNDNGFIVLVGEPRLMRPKNKADALYGPQA